ncbi:hypothetical protein CsatA_024154 [Cannabis sativa]
MAGTAKRGSGRLSPDQFIVVLGFIIPYFALRNYINIYHFQTCKKRVKLCLYQKQLTWISMASASMDKSSNVRVEEVAEEVENFSLEDFSIQLAPDSEAAKNTIASSVVGRFFSRRDFSTATMRGALTGMWRLQRGWRFQMVDRKTKTFIFRLSSEGEARFILSNGPWSPCDGFMMVAAMPEDGQWTSADLDSLDIWVKAHGIPLELMTDEAAVLLANRVGIYVTSDKVRKKGILMNSFLRFKSRINIRLPLVPGVSLEGNGKKKHWAFFKFERLPVFCFKCGVIGHLENMCFGRKRVVLVDDGRSVPLFGPWIRDGSRLENGFALLEVEDIRDREVLEKSDGQPVGLESGNGGSSGYPIAALPPQMGSDLAGLGSRHSELVSKNLLAGGMEGVPRQRSDTAFSVAYNDYVQLPFPAQHVAHVAKIFQDKLGPIRFGATREGEASGKPPKSAIHLKKPQMVGPKGVHKKLVFRFSNRDLESHSGAKRKKPMG